MSTHNMFFSGKILRYYSGYSSSLELRIITPEVCILGQIVNISKTKYNMAYMYKLEMCQYDTDAPAQGHPHPHAGILQKMKLKKGP